MDPARPPAILVSDAERAQAVVALRDATVEGRLTLEEFSDRIELAERARTAHDLAAAQAGLPAVAAGADMPVRHHAVFSSLERHGRWALATDSEVLCVGATTILDLGAATLAGAESTLRVRNWFGTVTILVPRGVQVTVDGGGAFSTRKIQLPDAGPVPDAPRLRIRTSGMFGTVRIHTADGPDALPADQDRIER